MSLEGGAGVGEGKGVCAVAERRADIIIRPQPVRKQMARFMNTHYLVAVEI
jgi:hypothetical protein